MTARHLPIQQRFEMYVIPEPNSGCFLWEGTLDAYGYGALRVLGKTIKAHRLAYKLHHGHLSKDIAVLHRCDNRCCVNVEHLFLGTRSDNLKDMWNKGRGVRGSAHGGAKVTDADVLEMRRSTDRVKTLAARYGLTPRTVRSILQRVTWKHI